MTKYCIFGGQYGSEGKGAFTEWKILNDLSSPNSLLIIAEPSPNSGHTCSKGKLRNLPIGAFYASVVVLGPDSLIDLDILREDLAAVREVNSGLGVIVHDRVGLIFPEDRKVENEYGLVGRVASTNSGVGSARANKYCWRHKNRIIQHNPHAKRVLNSLDAVVVNSYEYFDLLDHYFNNDELTVIFECNQGVMLDPNFGHFPYCTSRTCLPDVALTRNGLDPSYFVKIGVFRTYPIRTGGNSGPTGGLELEWSDIPNAEPEIATVTKRIRRVFNFSLKEFNYVMNMTRPSDIAFTHLDYTEEPYNPEVWMASVGLAGFEDVYPHLDRVYNSSKAGEFFLLA